jgi:hypothetical protein
MKSQRYIIAKKNGKILDAEWVSRFGMSHLDVRAEKNAKLDNTADLDYVQNSASGLHNVEMAGEETLERGGSEILGQNSEII